MSFSTDWDDLYRSNQHLSVWPWSDLVSQVYRHAHPAKGFPSVLELGCGAGANIPLFLKLEADYRAVDGSPAIVERVLANYPQLAGRIAVADFTTSIPFDMSFDLVIDRASLTHNDTAGVARGLKLACEKLRPGGKFIGIDWFSDQHPDAGNGDRVDEHSRQNMPPGSALAGTGTVHFFSYEHLVALLTDAGFALDVIDHRRVESLLPARAVQLGAWNFVVTKPPRSDLR